MHSETSLLAMVFGVPSIHDAPILGQFPLAATFLFLLGKNFFRPSLSSQGQFALVAKG